MSILNEALIFLIKTAINLYCMVVLLQLLFQYFGFNLPPSFSQLILKATHPVLTPLQRIMPVYHKINFALITLLVLLKSLELLLTTLLMYGFVPNLFSLIIWPMGEILSQTINLLFFAILIVGALSWFAPRSHNPFTNLLTQVTEPLLTPARKWLPTIGGIDLSPIVVLTLLKLLEIVLAHPLKALGLRLVH